MGQRGLVPGLRTDSASAWRHGLHRPWIARFRCALQTNLGRLPRALEAAGLAGKPDAAWQYPLRAALARIGRAILAVSDGATALIASHVRRGELPRPGRGSVD